MAHILVLYLTFYFLYQFQEQKPSRKEVLTSAQDDDEAEASHEHTREDSKSPTSSGNFENPKTPSDETETCPLKPSKNNGEQSGETSVSEDKAPKKPDKILPCPRCNSMDTKFCYYNNYNVNQPRHFCKNCQRYWTAGGTMRNVPVGAGRRKNKNSSSIASHYHQMMVPETLQTANNGLHNAMLGNNGSANFLTFGSSNSPPLCDSMASVLSLAEKKKTPTPNGVVLNGFHAPKCREDNNSNGDDSSVGGGSVMASTISSDKKGNNCGSHEEISLDNKSYQGLPFQFPFQQGSSTTPWPYPWNPAMPPPHAFYQPNYPVSFYPNPAYWGGCLPPSNWRVHTLSPQSSVNQSTLTSGPNSPTLGKHSRDEDNNTENNNNNNNNSSSSNSVLIPKTMRIDDSTEAAMSSIWSTLGIKNEKGSSLNGRGLFKAFASSKGGDGDKNHVVEASPVLQANPAALSRSLVFHERT